MPLSTFNESFALADKSGSSNDNPIIAAEPVKSVNKGLPDSTIKDSSTNKDTIQQQETLNSDKKRQNYSQPGKIKISTGIYYTPEWLFNIIEPNKYSTNFGVEGTFHFGKYSIRTGAGLSITKGTNELSIAYNEFLGSYKQLDSMSFAWNQQHTKMIPTYYLSDKDVWDSLMKLENAKIIKRYTYLQVPLILGYDFWSNDRFSFGARIGPILSILLYTKQLSDNYDPGKNRIILINEISPERIQTNWQIMAGFNFGIGISRHFGIELEPDVRYYFNSVYEKSGIDQKPWSLGFRAAFLIKY